MELLQEKIDAYLAFCESGEILEHCADATDRRIVFLVMFKYPPSNEGFRFVERAIPIVQGAGFDLRYEVPDGV